MEWQAIVLTLQILLLALGWTLFQKARAELSARAAEAPILGEVKALQRNIKQLLAELEQTADNTATHLEARIETARDVLETLERKLEESMLHQHAYVNMAPQETSGQPSGGRKGKKTAFTAETPASNTHIVQGLAHSLENRDKSTRNTTTHSLREARRDTIYRLADAGETPAAIACRTKLTEGEVETLLGLRRQG